MVQIKKQIVEKKSSWLIIILILLLLSFFSFIIAGIFSLFLTEPAQTGNVALIDVKGVISVDADDSYYLSGSSTSSTEIVRLIEQARDDELVKAVIFDINSPGGSAVASSEIANAIKELREYNKTTVALIREIGTSGGYWVASATNRIVAHDLSITGSIGVISSYLEVSDLLSKYNITYQRLVSGDKKDMGTPYKELTEEEKELYQKKLDYIHEAFINEVANNRNLEYDYVKDIADGSFVLGGEALNLGLVDELGGKKEAVEYIENQLNITAQVIEYKEEEGLLDILTKLISSQFFNIGQGIGSMIVKEQKREIIV